MNIPRDGRVGDDDEIGGNDFDRTRCGLLVLPTPRRPPPREDETRPSRRVGRPVPSDLRFGDLLEAVRPLLLVVVVVRRVRRRGPSSSS